MIDLGEVMGQDGIKECVSVCVCVCVCAGGGADIKSTSGQIVLR